MFRFKRTMTAIFLITVLSVGIYMVGCDSTSVESDNNNNKTTTNFNNSLFTTTPLKDIIANDPISLSILELNNFDVELVTSELNKSEKSITFGLKTYSNTTGTKIMNLKVQVYKENEFFGYTNTLSDYNKNLIWEYGLSIDTLHENHVRLFEKTKNDFLILDRYINENTITEKYEINGNSEEFTLYTKDTDRIAELNNLVFKSLNSKTKNVVSVSLSSSDQMTLNTLERFHEFYKTENSLHDNIYGQLSIELMGNENLLAWFQDEYVPDNTDPQVSWWFDELCKGLNICTAIKCGFLGPGNPVCDVCAIGSLSCEIARFLEPEIF